MTVFGPDAIPWNTTQVASTITMLHLTLQETMAIDVYNIIASFLEFMTHCCLIGDKKCEVFWGAFQFQAQTRGRASRTFALIEEMLRAIKMCEPYGALPPVWRAAAIFTSLSIKFQPTGIQGGWELTGPVFLWGAFELWERGTWWSLV